MSRQSSQSSDTPWTWSQFGWRELDWKVVIVLVTTALVLTLSNYFGTRAYPSRFVLHALEWMSGQAPDLMASMGLDRPREAFAAQPRGQLWQLECWAGFHVIVYFVIPALVIKFVFRERLSDYGLKLKGWFRKAWIYVLAFVVMVPLILIAGRSESFQQVYPFYSGAGNSWFDFLVWEAGYAAQFLALEFFFRGFIVHGLKHRFGIYAALIMAVPYCMIHFGKPLAESIGALLGGTFLGVLSLWTRSIWLGFLIHVSVALTMDLTAMYYEQTLQQLFG